MLVRTSRSWLKLQKGLFWSGMQPVNTTKSGLPPQQVHPEPAASPQEVRCAVRFPLELPVALWTGSGDELAARTQNVSASGVLFELDCALQTGLPIRFSLRMPGAVLGTPHDVLVHCTGRVVRCSMSQSQYLAAATIDEYQFAEQ